MALNQLILASASQEGKLLEQIGVTPSLVIHADIDEIPKKAERPVNLQAHGSCQGLKILIPKINMF